MGGLNQIKSSFNRKRHTRDLIHPPHTRKPPVTELSAASSTSAPSQHQGMSPKPIPFLKGLTRILPSSPPPNPIPPQHNERLEHQITPQSRNSTRFSFTAGISRRSTITDRLKIPNNTPTIARVNTRFDPP